MKHPIITTNCPSIVRSLRTMALGIALLVASASVALGQVITKQVGHPTWKPVDFHIFAAPLGTFESGFAEFSETQQDLLPPPKHELSPVVGIVPGTPHAPPYDEELADGVEDNDFVDKTTFRIKEFSLPSGIWVVWMNVPAEKKPKGSSPDFKKGPIIPNTIFPISVVGVTLRNGELFNPDVVPRFDVPPTTQLSPPFDVDGHSHFPIFVADAMDFVSPPNPAGRYEYRIQMRDKTGSGWNISAFFTVTARQPHHDDRNDDEGEHHSGRK